MINVQVWFTMRLSTHRYFPGFTELKFKTSHKSQKSADLG